MTTLETTEFEAPNRHSRFLGLEGRYFLALLSMAAIDLFLSGVFLFLSGKLWLLALRLPEVIVLLGVVPLLGGRYLFTPIRRFMATGQGEAAARERAAKLGPLTTIWAIMAATVFTVWSFFIAPFVIFDVDATRDVIYILIGRALAWVVLLPYVAVFAIQEYLRYMRSTLFERYGIVVPPGQAHLGRKLALILLGGAIVPGASIAITLTLVPEISPITGQPRSVVIITTLVGVGIALALAFWATQRSTTAAFRTLLGGMRRVQQGDLGTAIPIETDDELGRLSEGFNALTDALAAARHETDLKEAERAHTASQFHEAQKREALGRLAAGIAHDFNNILSIITMYSTMAQKRCADDEITHKRLAEVLTATGRGRDLISQILDFARDKPVDHTPLDLVENVRETVTLIGDTLAHEVAITTDMPDHRLMIMGDATGLHQVIANLMINAVHAMPDTDSTLSVSLDTIQTNGGRASGLRIQSTGEKSPIIFEHEEDGTAHALLGILPPGLHARISVRDTGTGMTQETLRSVFNPYFTTKPVGQGTGLGLAAVAGVIETHGGAIHVKIKVGAGTCFDIIIPVAKPEESGNG